MEALAISDITQERSPYGGDFNFINIIIHRHTVRSGRDHDLTHWCHSVRSGRDLDLTRRCHSQHVSIELSFTDQLRDIKYHVSIELSFADQLRDIKYVFQRACEVSSL